MIFILCGAVHTLATARYRGRTFQLYAPQHLVDTLREPSVVGRRDSAGPYQSLLSDHQVRAQRHSPAAALHAPPSTSAARPRTTQPVPSPVGSPSRSAALPLMNTSRKPVASWCGRSKVAWPWMVTGSNTITSACAPALRRLRCGSDSMSVGSVVSLRTASSTRSAWSRRTNCANRRAKLARAGGRPRAGTRLRALPPPRRSRS